MLPNLNAKAFLMGSEERLIKKKMFTKGLFLAALATLTANAATVRQMVSQPATAYIATDAAIEANAASFIQTSCDDSYCFRNTGCISTRWDQQI